MKKPLFLSLILLISVTICFAQPCSVQLNIDNPVYCYGICGAAIEAQATGTGNLTYVWSPNVSTNSLATDLCPGKYKVTMTDANNCKAVDSLVLGQPDTLNVTATVTNVKCYGVCNGKISIVVTGGTSPFQYSWNGSADTTQNLDSVCAGNYCLTVSDTNGCMYNTCNIFVNSPDSLAIYTSTSQFGPTNIDCYGDSTGYIETYIEGGKPPYKYHWLPNDTSESLYNLGAGTYIFTVSDSNRCTAVDTTVLTQPNPYQVVISTSNFNGYQVSCSSSTNGMICLTASGETQPYTYYWSPISSNDSCISNLGAGSYCITVLDVNGCELDSCINLNEPEILVDDFSYDNPSSSTSYDGDITTDVYGGVPPYSYDWNPNVSSDSVATNLGNYTYIICVSDANGCSTCDTVVLTSPLFVPGIGNDLSATIFPNPSNGQFSVIFKTTIYDATIRVVDLLGQEVYNESFSSITNKVDLNIKAPEGIYFVQVVNETGSWVGRFAIR